MEECVEGQCFPILPARVVPLWAGGGRDGGLFQEGGDLQFIAESECVLRTLSGGCCIRGPKGLGWLVPGPESHERVDSREQSRGPGN